MLIKSVSLSPLWLVNGLSTANENLALGIFELVYLSSGSLDNLPINTTLLIKHLLPVYLSNFTIIWRINSSLIVANLSNSLIASASDSTLIKK